MPLVKETKKNLCDIRNNDSCVYDAKEILHNIQLISPPFSMSHNKYHLVDSFINCKKASHLILFSTDSMSCR